MKKNSLECGQRVNLPQHKKKIYDKLIDKVILNPKTLKVFSSGKFNFDYLWQFYSAYFWNFYPPQSDKKKKYRESKLERKK